MLVLLTVDFIYRGTSVGIHIEDAQNHPSSFAFRQHCGFEINTKPKLDSRLDSVLRELEVWLTRFELLAITIRNSLSNTQSTIDSFNTCALSDSSRCGFEAMFVFVLC